MVSHPPTHFFSSRHPNGEGTGPHQWWLVVNLDALGEMSLRPSCSNLKLGPKVHKIYGNGPIFDWFALYRYGYTLRRGLPIKGCVDLKHKGIPFLRCLTTGDVVFDDMWALDVGKLCWHEVCVSTQPCHLVLHVYMLLKDLVPSGGTASCTKLSSGFSSELPQECLLAAPARRIFSRYHRKSFFF